MENIKEYCKECEEIRMFKYHGPMNLITGGGKETVHVETYMCPVCSNLIIKDEEIDEE